MVRDRKTEVSGGEIEDHDRYRDQSSHKVNVIGGCPRNKKREGVARSLKICASFAPVGEVS